MATIDDHEKATPGVEGKVTADTLDNRVNAADAAELEKGMSLWQGIKMYPKAVGFSVIVSACIIMEGYDVNLLQGLFAFAPFTRRYGQPSSDGTYQLSAAWQAGLANGASVGEIMGLFINGWAAERFGYRRTLLISLFFVTCFIFILFFAPSVEVLLVGEILCGIPWGVFQTLTTVYASEVCPVNLRQYLTTYVNLCWVIGTILGQGVLRAFLDSGSTQWAYRIPFAIQWIWPIPIAVGIFFAPESPWWLVRQGRTVDAKKALTALQAKGADEAEVDATLSMLTLTHKYERDSEVQAGYLDCFKGVDLRRTEITCMVWAIQNLSGSGFMGYSTYFFQQAGLNGAESFDVAMAQYAGGCIATVLSWFLMAHFGRRSLYLFGICFQFIILLITGFLGLAKASDAAAPWAVAAMMVAYTFVFDMTVGPVCYALVPEIPSGRLRTRTVVLGRNLYNIINIVMNIIIPYMLNPDAWNWKAKAGFFYAGLCFLCGVWIFFRLPEPKGRTYAELDALFERGVPARKFATTDIDIFDVQTSIEHRNASLAEEKAQGLSHHMETKGAE